MGQSIRAYRKHARLSQEKLAEKAGVDPTYISEIECGRANVSVDVLQRIAKPLGCQIRDFFPYQSR